MNDSGHVGMDQANQLEVPDAWERHVIALACCRGARGDARGAIEAGSIGCGAVSLASRKHIEHLPMERRPHLAGFQKGHGVELISGKGPADCVACMNPKLVWQKRLSLASHITALGSPSSVPLCHLPP